MNLPKRSVKKPQLLHFIVSKASLLLQILGINTDNTTTRKTILLLRLKALSIAWDTAGTRIRAASGALLFLEADPHSRTHRPTRTSPALSGSKIYLESPIAVLDPAVQLTVLLTLRTALLYDLSSLLWIQAAGLGYATRVWCRTFCAGRYTKRLLCIMVYDTSWDINQCESIFESSEHWKFRQAFLIANKKKYPRDRLVALSNIFINAEFMECKYPKPTMDLIENLSKDFVDDLRNMLNLKVPKISMTDSNAAGSKDNENAETCATSNMKNNQPPNKLMRYLTPYDTNCIIPGFILKTSQGVSIHGILEQSCSFSGIAKPEIKYEHLSSSHVRSKLYLQNKLIAVGDSNTEKMAHKNVLNIAYDILREMCFTIKVKEIDKQSQITLSDIVNDLIIDTTIDSNTTTYYDKISDNNVGNKILKNMGWKEGDGLGKNNQGITSPIEIIHLKKRSGLGIVNRETNTINLKDFKIKVKNYIMRFIDSPNKRLSFSSEFTKEERIVIHSICTHVGLRAKSHGNQANRQLVIMKIQTSQDIFYELKNCSNFENDCYILIPPLHESNNEQCSMEL